MDDIDVILESGTYASPVPNTTMDDDAHGRVCRRTNHLVGYPQRRPVVCADVLRDVYPSQLRLERVCDTVGVAMSVSTDGPDGPYDRRGSRGVYCCRGVEGCLYGFGCER